MGSWYLTYKCHSILQMNLMPPPLSPNPLHQSQMVPPALSATLSSRRLHILNESKDTAACNMASTTTGQSGERNPKNIFYNTETRCSMLHMFESYIYQISVFITTT